MIDVGPRRDVVWGRGIVGDVGVGELALDSVPTWADERFPESEGLGEKVAEREVESGRGLVDSCTAERRVGFGVTARFEKRCASAFFSSILRVPMWSSSNNPARNIASFGFGGAIRMTLQAMRQTVLSGNSRRT